MLGNTQLGTTLAEAGKLQDVHGLWFNSKNIVLDGYRFINCRFDLCQLTILSSQFELLSCHIDENTQILYGIDPLKVIKIWNSRNPAMYNQWPMYAPIRNADGTISIKGI
jgi:hypothetical protein